MSFFNYTPPEAPEVKPPEPKIPPHFVIFDGATLIKEVPDNPELQEVPVDTGEGMSRMWRPLNYNPTTKEVNK